MAAPQLPRTYPEGPSTQCLWSLVPNTINRMVVEAEALHIGCLDSLGYKVASENGDRYAKRSSRRCPDLHDTHPRSTWWSMVSYEWTHKHDSCGYCYGWGTYNCGIPPQQCPGACMLRFVANVGHDCRQRLVKAETQGLVLPDCGLYPANGCSELQHNHLRSCES